MMSWCIPAVRRSYSLASASLLRTRASPRLLCTAAQQNGQAHLEESLLKEQLKEVTEKYWRSLADMENLRARHQKILEDTKLYGIQRFSKDLLEVPDILEKATKSVPKAEVNNNNPHLKNLFDGLVMTLAQVQKVFSKHGLVRLEPVGQMFDPYEHKALLHVPVPGKEPGSVATVTRPGYKLHGRTIRSAHVHVVKPPESSGD